MRHPALDSHVVGHGLVEVDQTPGNQRWAVSVVTRLESTKVGHTSAFSSMTAQSTTTEDRGLCSTRSLLRPGRQRWRQPSCSRCTTTESTVEQASTQTPTVVGSFEWSVRVPRVLPFVVPAGDDIVSPDAPAAPER